MEGVSLTRTCVLKLGGDLRDKDHGFFVRLLLRAGLKPEEIKLIDLVGRHGYCKFSFSTRAALERLLGQVVVHGETRLHFLVGDGSVKLLHIFGVDDDLPLSTIIRAARKFGQVIGEPQRETKTVEECTFCTGTVFLQLLPKSAVPSTLYVDVNKEAAIADFQKCLKLRVWHEGQTQTCFECGSVDHKARKCTNKTRTLAAVVRNGALNANIDSLLQAARGSAEQAACASEGNGAECFDTSSPATVDAALTSHATPEAERRGSVKVVHLGAKVVPNEDSDASSSSASAVHASQCTPHTVSDTSTVAGSRASKSASMECIAPASPALGSVSLIDFPSLHHGNQPVGDERDGKWQVHSNKRPHTRSATSSVEASPSNGNGKQSKKSKKSKKCQESS